MLASSNKTQTITGSIISSIFKIYRKKPEWSSNKKVNTGQWTTLSLFLVLAFLLLPLICNVLTVRAITDPLKATNDRFGIHLAGESDEEASEAASLVNSSGGDWGYVTVVMQDSDRNQKKWQSFFDDLRVRHLIPIVRLATHPNGNFWEVPYNNEEVAWADFLNSLNWPTKNRYVIVYNEPNQSQEWGNSTDATTYAQTLSKTIDALKSKSQDFFILNAGLDAEAPQKLPNYEDEDNFLKEMETAMPGIFNKLDGWVSHSYPDPGYVGSPDGSGRGSVSTYKWELSVLKNLGLSKNLPVFITETGWKHAEGKVYDGSLPSSEQVGANLKEAFSNVWSDPQIVAVTPFLLDYQDSPFDHFSFKKLTGETQNEKILGISTNDSPFYPQYQIFQSIPKTQGAPIQVNQGTLTQGSIYYSLVSGQSYRIPLVFQNNGQSIWNDGQTLKLIPTLGQMELGIKVDPIPSSVKVLPKQTYTFWLNLSTPQTGNFKVQLSLFNGQTQIETGPLEFITSVKSPVSIDIKASLKWKNDFSGSYILQILSDAVSSTRNLILGTSGDSDVIQATELLPDYSYNFTLKKPFYQPKTLKVQVHSGLNVLDFGELKPDIGSAILHPVSFWKLLPWSN